MPETASVITRFNICKVICSAFSKSFSPETVTTSFRHSGIHSFNHSAVSDDSLLPAEVFHVGVSDAHSQAKVEGGVEAGPPEPDIILKAREKS